MIRIILAVPLVYHILPYYISFNFQPIIFIAVLHCIQVFKSCMAIRIIYFVSNCIISTQNLSQEAKTLVAFGFSVFCHLCAS